MKQDIDTHTAAYFAGLFDGEGSIYITQNRYKTQHTRIVIANTNPTPLHLAKSLFGGSITVKPAAKNWRACFSWVIVCKAALRFMQTIRPYCHIKGEEIDLAIVFESSVGTRGQRHSTPPDIAKLRQEIYEKLQQLKRRDFATPTSTDGAHDLPLNMVQKAAGA